MKFILIILIVMSFLGCSDSSKSVSKIDNFKLNGDWESSGGDGVICFLTEKIKIKNKDLLSTPKGFNKIPKNQILSLSALEFYEFFEDGYESKLTLWDDLDTNVDYKIILDQVLNRLRVYSPVFSQKLDLVLEHIQVEEWVPSQALIQIEDSSPHRDLANNCELIQLADRQTQSSEGYLPKAKVFFRKDLFDSLSEINKSVLVLHEALYLIGRETNHSDSNLIRIINTLLFSNQFESDFLNAPYFSQQSKEIQELLTKYFGDYLQFFVKEDFYLNPKDYSNIKYSNNYTRSVSFIQMNHEMREYIQSCFSVLSPAECKDKLMLGLDLLTFVNSEEKAFLFLMNYFFDTKGMIPTSTEHLYVLDFNDPLKQDESIQLKLGGACGHLEGFIAVEMGLEGLNLDFEGLLIVEGEQAQNIQNHFKDLIWFKDFTLPALKYCRDVRKALRE